ncbi:glycosyltransferase family A protein [Mesorhizobium sp. M1403]|uniref:glycosyltransferase family 2 protein n=1 Tax=Mesorhizobium sp. M1403 TaxID=2957097 RepID=UPI00333B6E0E
MTEASVVICAQTLDRWLNVATASVRRQTRPAREIILVDNNEALLGRTQREINGVVVTPLCGCRTTGAGSSTAPVLAFLDDDAIADERWLDELLMPTPTHACLASAPASSLYGANLGPGGFLCRKPDSG